MKNRIDPNFAMSPTLRMICVPASTSHAVHISTNSAVPYTPRYKKCCGRRGAVISSREKMGPISIEMDRLRQSQRKLTADDTDNYGPRSELIPAIRGSKYSPMTPLGHLL